MNGKLYLLCIVCYSIGLILSLILLYIRHIIIYKNERKKHYESGSPWEFTSFDEFESYKWDEGYNLGFVVLWPFTIIAIFIIGICDIIKFGLKKLFKV